MVVLVGKSLGERQREINSKVADIIAAKTNFDEVKNEPEESDIDKFIKIDVASKFKYIDYIIEVLTSGDSLHISRVLKCEWLYVEAYHHIFNTDNLHTNIFPYMSFKMKNKLLSSISMHIRNAERAATFFSYCIKNNMTHIAYKFLNFTSEEFKLDVLNDKKFNIMHNYLNEPKRIKDFVGNSIILATACVESSGNMNSMLDNLLFMYSLSNIKYLDLLENYYVVHLDQYSKFKQFGLRVSREIMVKHKSRVLTKPLLYVFKINKRMLLKYSTTDDVKMYASLSMPADVAEFWNLHSDGRYKYIYDAIPANERFEFVKDLFTTKYPSEPFEINIKFYTSKCYSFMTPEEQSLWALRHIERGEELLGKEKNYLWYEFVKFEKSFNELKKLLLITTNRYKRSEILNVLVKSAKYQKDLTKLLNYYYEKHVNENYFDKQTFIEEVVDIYNVFEFDGECWTALEKLFSSLDVYTVGRHSNKSFEAIAIINHALRKLDMPQKLKDFIECDINYSYFRCYLEKLGKVKSEIVFQYILHLLLERLKPFEQDPFNKKLGKSLKQYVDNIWTLLNCFQKDDNKDCPEIVKRFMSIHSPTKKEISANDIFRLLKQDASLSLDALSHFENIAKDTSCAKNNVLRKLRIYFFNDVAKQYVSTLNSWLSNLPQDSYEHSVILGVVFALFQLGDENTKMELLAKYVPTDSGIDHLNIDRSGTKTTLYVQEAICRYMGYSRPPIPLENVIQYMKRDYIHYCLPIFNMYMANLPLPLFLKFTEATLNSPVSMQKHGLRLAFKCYSTENLTELLRKVWKKTKHVSLRSILYKSLYYKIVDDNENTQMELFENLKLFTSEVHEEDDNEIFTLILGHDIPDRFKGDHLQTAWSTVSKFPDKPVNIRRRCEVICSLERHINLVQRDFLRKFILDEHVHDMLENKRLKTSNNCDIEALSDAKWRLTEKYIVNCTSEVELKASLDLTQYVINKSVAIWDEINENRFISRRFCKEFINHIISSSSTLIDTSIVIILQNILDLLQAALPMREIYFYIWNLRLTIISKNILCNNDVLNDNEDYFSREVLIKDLCVKFSYQIRNLVLEFKEKQQYYGIFSSAIAQLIMSTLKNMILILREDITLDLCESLVNLGVMETHLLALLIMPVTLEFTSDALKYENRKRVHNMILQKVREFNNDEVQILLNSVFVQENIGNVVPHGPEFPTEVWLS